MTEAEIRREQQDDWAEDADRLNRMAASARAAGVTCPAPTPEEAVANALNERLAENFDTDQPRDDDGRWSGGGASAGERVKTAVERVGTFGRDMDDQKKDWGLADHAVAELRSLPREEIFRHLKDAGIEGARPTDSKKALLERLHNRLTAGVRARERAEV